MRIEIVVFDGFDELDAFAPYEVLHTAEAKADFTVALVGADGPGQVRGAHGVVLDVADGIGTPDALLVVGGGWLANSPRGAKQQADDGALTATIAKLAPSMKWTASVCSGGMLLAEAGILRGRTATTNRRLHGLLADYGVTVRTERVVDDGDIITAGGITCGFDLAARIVEREAGPELAAETMAHIEYNRDLAESYVVPR